MLQQANKRYTFSRVKMQLGVHQNHPEQNVWQLSQMKYQVHSCTMSSNGMLIEPIQQSANPNSRFMRLELTVLSI